MNKDKIEKEVLKEIKKQALDYNGLKKRIIDELIMEENLIQIAIQLTQKLTA